MRRGENEDSISLLGDEHNIQDFQLFDVESYYASTPFRSTPHMEQSVAASIALQRPCIISRASKVIGLLVDIRLRPNAMKARLLHFLKPGHRRQ